MNRTLKDTGIVSLIVDYSDHYSHTDNSIGPLNYLNYNELEWAKFNHNCHFQNRLRHYDYVEILHYCGFKVVEENLNYMIDDGNEYIKSKFSQADKPWAATSAHIFAQKVFDAI